MPAKAKICRCAACSPISPEPGDQLRHSSLDAVTGPIRNTAQSDLNRYEPHYTRVYLHHLLHTHEMSAHALLVMHNLEVLDRFFEGIRGVLSIIESSEMYAKTDTTAPATSTHAHIPPSTLSLFTREIYRFWDTYDPQNRIMEEARRGWVTVEFERGKGRLAREKAKKKETELGAVEVGDVAISASSDGPVVEVGVDV